MPELVSATNRDEQTLKNLELTLKVYDKCLAYDYEQVHLNESMDDAPSTNIPGNWKALIVENPRCVKDLFSVLLE